LNISDVDVVMLGHVPDTVGSMVGDGQLLGLPPLELRGCGRHTTVHDASLADRVVRMRREWRVRTGSVADAGCRFSETRGRAAPTITAKQWQREDRSVS
jgi:hypothetical protein